MSTVRTVAVTAAGAVTLAAVLCGPALADAVTASLAAYVDTPASVTEGPVYGPFAAPAPLGADGGVVAGAEPLVVPGAAPAPASFAASGVPGRVLEAYRAAAAAADPRCRLDWSLLAAVGHVESGHARGGRLDAAGRTATPIVGPALNGGPGVRAIADTDDGRLDGDPYWDRAVGPMQFIPGTWAGSGADANGDGRADPHQIDDATLAAARYLCAGGADLSTPAGARSAVLRYNASDAYANRVLYLAGAYRDGVPVRAGYPALTGPTAPLAGPVAPAGPIGPAPIAPAPIVPAPVAPAPVAPVPAPAAPETLVPGPTPDPTTTTPAPVTPTPGTTTPDPTSEPAPTTPAATTQAPTSTTTTSTTTAGRTTTAAPSSTTTPSATTAGATSTTGGTAADPTCTPGPTTCPTPTPTP